nr:ethylbenzene dehydrogenase-related protein [Pleionea sp. CnH1-48]
MVVATLTLGLLLNFALSTQKTIPLTVHKVDIKELINIDGQANESIWQSIEPVSVWTYGGANFVDGSTQVQIKTIENGVEAFFHIEWQDPTKSLKHLPLKKTADGWQIQQSGFYQFDETEFYEDKLAVMLSDSCDAGGSATAHLGPKPLSDKPANWHGKGYHYSYSTKQTDIWHWKAVRTNDMILADDNFFGKPQTARPGDRRYTAGYTPDGKESGAYVMNWKWYNKDIITPKRLPKSAQQLASFQQSDNASALNWIIPWFGYEPYQKAKDNYPIGTIMPSVMYRSNRFEGDRADVRAFAQWNNGKWSLELSRKLDTGSNNDVKLQSGVCLWIAAFDHAQIAHTRHSRALQLQWQDS